MEDIIRALLDVVRAQHTAAQETEEAPFDMNDIVDMAMNIVGRPDESEEEEEMVDTIQRLVGTLAPDIFPPKTFEEMDDKERAASVANMIEERLRRGMTGAVAGGAGRTAPAACGKARGRPAGRGRGVAGRCRSVPRAVRRRSRGAPARGKKQGRNRRVPAAPLGNR